MNEKLEQLFDDVAEIKRALLGETKWGEPGLIKDVKALKAWRNKMQLKMAFWSGVGGVIALIGQAVIEYLTKK